MRDAVASYDYEGVAISMPGRIDTSAGIAHTGGAFSWLREYPAAQKYGAVFGKPCTIANDGKCAALAESWMGALADIDSGAVLVLGTGIGGGIVVVSALVYLFSGQFGASEYLQHTAVGTAFAVMVVTGLVNVFAQKKSRNVDWAVCRKFAPFLFAGVVLGSVFTLGLPEKFLRIIFVLFL